VTPLYHRVLITGANGLVGQALVQRFSAIPEVDLLATSRETAPRFSASAGGYAPLDVTDEDAVRRVFVDFAPTAVVHCAAFSKVEACEEDREACWAVNVDATDHLARACRAHGARLVLLSTDFVFDGTAGPYGERDRPGPVNFYGRSKLAAENAVRSAGLHRWTVVRTTLGFGAGEDLRRGNIGTFLVEQLAAGQARTSAEATSARSSWSSLRRARARPCPPTRSAPPPTSLTSPMGLRVRWCRTRGGSTTWAGAS